MNRSARLSSSSHGHVSLVAFFLVFAVFSGGCKRTVPAEALGSPVPLGRQAVEASFSELDTKVAVHRLEENFARVYFDFDATRLSVEGGRLLDENAMILARHPSLVVELQGHADPRGATSYNLALGTRRTQSVRHRLMARGISADRLPTVTFGEERPRADGTHEAAHAENRRVEFRVVHGGADGVIGTID